MSWLDRFFASRNYGSMQYNGAVMPPEPNFNFAGSGVTVTDDPSNLRTTITIAAGATITFGGDLSGTDSSQTVNKIKGTMITTAGGALPVGAVLRTTAVGTADWGPVNLADADAVDGILSTPNGGTNLSTIGLEGELLSTNGAGSALEYRPYFCPFPTAEQAATGMIRVSDQGTVPVIVGLSSGVDYSGLKFSAAGSTWTYGDAALYTQENCFDWRMTNAYGMTVQMTNTFTFNDVVTGLTTDLTQISQVLAANYTNTNSAGGTLTTLTFNAADGEVWFLEFRGTIQCSSTGGLKFAIHAPAGSVCEGAIHGQLGTGLNTYGSIRITDSATPTYVGAFSAVATTPQGLWGQARIKLVGNGGAITIGCRPVTNTQTATLFAGFYLRARRATEV